MPQGCILVSEILELEEGYGYSVKEEHDVGSPVSPLINCELINS